MGKLSFSNTCNIQVLFLKEFKLGLSYKGEKGSMDVQTDTQYSDWNKVEEDEFKAPQ